MVHSCLSAYGLPQDDLNYCINQNFQPTKNKEVKCNKNDIADFFLAVSFLFVPLVQFEGKKSNALYRKHVYLVLILISTELLHLPLIKFSIKS